MARIDDILRQAGFTGPQLQMARAIMLAESGGRPTAHNPNAGTGDNSYGLFQINMLGDMGPARRRQFGLSSNEALFDPLTNARVAYQMSQGGTNWSPWSTYKTGAYRKYMGNTPAAVASPVIPMHTGRSAAPAPAPRMANTQLVDSLLSSLGQFAQTGKVGNLNLAALRKTREMQTPLGPSLADPHTDSGTENHPQSGGGFTDDFQQRLDALVAASGGKIKVTSGYRSPERQAELFAAAVKKYGSEAAARKWVAPPGKSRHGMGIAADLSGDLSWAHKNARRFGLYFPMSWENWHIEPLGSR